MSLFEVFAGRIRVSAGTSVSIVFARAAPIRHDLRDVMVAHLCAILGLGGVMCALAAALAVALRSFI